MKSPISLKVILFLMLICDFLVCSFPKASFASVPFKDNKSKYVIMIDANAKQLSVIDVNKQKTIKVYPIAT